MKKTAILFFIVSLSINLNGQHKEYVEVLSNYLQFPSIEGNEREAGRFFQQECEKRGLYTKMLSNDSTVFNFIASIYPLSENKPNIIFLNHIDVVDAIDTSDWKYPPFSGLVKDSVVWGRGAIDNKGMGVAQLAAIADFADRYKSLELPFNVSLLSVSGEETGSKGAIEISNNWLDSLNIHFILGEGGSGVTDVISSDPDKPVFGISASEKTRVVLKLELNLNTSGHASMPPKQYALKEMIQALSRIINSKKELTYNDVNSKSLWQLGKVERGIKGFVLRHHRFLLFRPLVNSAIRKEPMIASFFSNTVSITDVSSPVSADNQFPGTVRATFDCRILPGTDINAFIHNIEKKLRDDRIRVTTHSIMGSTKRTFISKYFDALDESIKEVYPTATNIEIIFPATSDNSVFRNKDIPVFGLFPGIFTEQALENVHSNNEHIPIAVLDNAIDVYFRFLQKFISMDWNKAGLSAATN